MRWVSWEHFCTRILSRSIHRAESSVVLTGKLAYRIIISDRTPSSLNHFVGRIVSLLHDGLILAGPPSRPTDRIRELIAVLEEEETTPHTDAFSLVVFFV